MLNQKKVEIFLVKIRKSLAKQFLEIAYKQLLKIPLASKIKNLPLFLWEFSVCKSYIFNCQSLFVKNV